MISLQVFNNDEPKDCFKKFIGIELTADIQQINCSDSTDYNFQMAFNCNTKTLDRIVSKFDLVYDRNFNYEDFQHIFIEYDWWKNENLNSIKRIYKSRPTKRGYSSGPWIFLCYDRNNSKLYFAIWDL